MTGLPTWLLVAAFVGAAAVIWPAGTRLSHAADRFAAATGMKRAFIGMLLLGGITSLPEVATTLTASLGGNAPLAVNNMLGGVAMQVTVLAIADASAGGSALAALVRTPGIVVQAASSIVLLALVVGGVVIGEVAVLGVGGWTLAVAVGYVLALAVAGSAAKPAWQAASEPAAIEEAAEGEPGPLGRILLELAVLGAVILAAGFVLTRSGERLAEITGLGSSFFGAVLIATATSLPELSTAIGAVRIGRAELAMGDVFGGNLADLALILLADAVYAGPPVLDEVGTFSAAAALLGIVLTSVAVIGVIERRDRTVLRMGYDSVVILVTYAAGLAMLYRLR